MATRKDYVVTPWRPDTSGNVRPIPFSEVATNDLYNTQAMLFADSGTDISAFGTFTVPDGYVGAPALVVRWVTTATSGDVRWQAGYRAIAVGEDYDPSTDQQSVGVTDTAAGTTLFLNEAIISLTAANFTVGDEVPFRITREGSNAADTLAAAAVITSVIFQYDDA